MLLLILAFCLQGHDALVESIDQPEVRFLILMQIIWLPKLQCFHDAGIYKKKKIIKGLIAKCLSSTILRAI